MFSFLKRTALKVDKLIEFLGNKEGINVCLQCT